MKPLQKFLRTGALVSALVGASALPALAAASPALATTAYGSGAAVQKKLQEAWISGDSASITYTSTNNAAGQAEFGNGNSTLDLTQDPVADAVPQLDGYTAVDSPVTPEEVGRADTAGGTGAKELTIPVAQVAEVIELNIPSGITLNASQNIDLTNQLAEELFSGNVPASADYSANTWGGLLEDSGLAKVSSAPTLGQFEDPKSTGGKVRISQVLRANGAGATLVFKQYLEDVATDALGNSDWSGVPIDENTEGTGEWPLGLGGTGVTISSRKSSDSLQAEAVFNTSGTAGYGTLGAAITAGFGASGSNKVYAFVQDNGVTSPPIYANPKKASGASNVYTGSSLNTSGTYKPMEQTGVGNWIVPTTGGSFNTTGQWATNGTTTSDYTHGWDIDAYDDAGEAIAFYPLDIVLWDLSWDHPSWGFGNLTKTNYNTPATVESTVKSYFEYVTTSATGQAATVTPHFAPLPSGILSDAQAVAAAL
jgi:hypothetical protein